MPAFTKRTMSNVAFSLTLVLPTKETYDSANLPAGVVFSLISLAISAVVERTMSNAGFGSFLLNVIVRRALIPPHGGVVAITDSEHVERVAAHHVGHSFALRAPQMS